MFDEAIKINIFHFPTTSSTQIDLIRRYHHVMHRVITAARRLQTIFYVILLSESNLQSLKIISSFIIIVETAHLIPPAARIQVVTTTRISH